MRVEDGTWFTEVCDEAGSAFSLRVTKKLYTERSRYQTIEVYETSHFGNLLVLDGFVMLSARDNFIYHEMMSHPALYTHPHPKRVLVIGGGDCGCLGEVLKHSEVTAAELVELDERVTRVSERFFPELYAANNDPRASLHFTDGVAWVARADRGAYDVIIVDSTDPVGQAARLFQAPFYASCRRALGDEGVLIVQSESPLIHLKLIHSVHAEMRKAGFQRVSTLHFPQCTYPSGWWSATLAGGRRPHKEFREPDARAKIFTTRYYSADIHRAALAQPAFMQEPPS
jgi:spermidine synthase